jgi:GT2 family glycosyltransferase
LDARHINKASVIIVTYFTGPILFRSIEAVLKQNNLFEIIIVNNGNDDITCKILKEIVEDNDFIKVINSPGNIGFGAGCNIGANHAKGKYLLFLNPDSIIIKPSTINILIDGLKDFPNTIVAGGKIINIDGSNQKTCIRNLLTPMIALSECLNLYKYFPKYFKSLNIDISNFKEPISSVPAITGACFMILRENFIKLEGFDEGFFLHVEDLDFCKRVKEIGNIIFVANAEITHFLSTSNISSNFVEKCKAKSFIYYFNKHYKSSVIKYLLFAAIKLRLQIKLLLNFIRSKSINDKHNLQYNFLCNKTDNKIEIKDDLLIAGVSNQIGLCLIKNLVNSDIKFKAFYYNNPINFYSKNIDWIQANFANDLLDLKHVDASVLIYTSPIWLLPNLLKKLNHANLTRIICFSSTSVFTKSTSENNYESELANKLKNSEAEIIKICVSKNIKYTILRPTLIYGLGIDKNVTSIVKFIKKFKCFLVYPPANGLRQPVHANDLAITALKIINNNVCFNQSFNLGGMEQLSYNQMLLRIFALLNMKPRIFKLSFLPILLNFAGKFLGKGINSSIAKRMNKDLIFDNEIPSNIFNYKPRAFNLTNEDFFFLEDK